MAVQQPFGAAAACSAARPAVRERLAQRADVAGGHVLGAASCPDVPKRISQRHRVARAAAQLELLAGTVARPQRRRVSGRGV